ncbi:MAG: tRNA (N(6)-L-threonylcarbamoyladenosine(37)-C(2))-methylthiotransferase MtaB [bacterium]|nr:tRNA (N(6)-L-threonylcarbamoyladenosine(37)-C(2))-methylthiotransferase MtaB [bacterium]
MRVFFTNLGCKLNQAEVDRLARRFVSAGHSLAPALEQAELHVINSCTVTHLAARDSRKIARRGRRLNGGLRTVLTGCYATDSPDEAAELAGVDLLVTNDSKDRLLELVHETFPDARPAAEVPAAGVPVHYVPISFGRARALVKVEDGCNMRCSFCIIPSTRGRQRSRPVDDVLAEVRELTAAGHREVVVTGVQISEYDDDGRRLYDLVAAILGETDVPRLRLTSIAPWKFDRRLLSLWSDPRLCRHVHMSLQSGSSATLKRMRRPYTADRYEALAELLRAEVNGLALTTDVIVGFPRETAGEFADSLAFVERLAFARPHVFTYSSRLGTDAATLPEQVPFAEKKARVTEMLAVARASDESFRRRWLGESLEVVWEDRKGGRWSGLSDNYVRVFADSGRDLSATTGRARLETLVEGGVHARCLEESLSDPAAA